MDVNLLFPSDYLRCADLQGRDCVITIKRVQMDTLKTDRGNERKPVVFMEGTKKKWVLNKTNAKTIAKLYGNETDAWVGKKVALFGTTCEAFGETVDCVRVRPSEPQTKQDGGMTDDEKRDANQELEQFAE